MLEDIEGQCTQLNSLKLHESPTQLNVSTLAYLNSHIQYIYRPWCWSTSFQYYCLLAQLRLWSVLTTVSGRDVQSGRNVQDLLWGGSRLVVCVWKKVIGAELCMDWGLQRHKTRNVSSVMRKFEFGDLRSCPISPFLAEQNNSHLRQHKKKFLPSLKILRTPQT